MSQVMQGMVLACGSMIVAEYAIVVFMYLCWVSPEHLFIYLQIQKFKLNWSAGLMDPEKPVADQQEENFKTQIEQQKDRYSARGNHYVYSDRGTLISR